MDTQSGFQLTGKIVGDKMYAYLRTNPATPSGGGCCADTLRIYNKTDSQYRDVDMASIVTTAMPPNTDAAASHTFDVKEINGVVYAFAMVKYTSPALATSLDAIVVFSTVDGTVLPTKDGAPFFNIYAVAGTTASGQDKAAAIFKIQFFKGSLSEEWHGNGVERFTTKDGTTILAITHRADSEAVIFKDPFTYPSAQGGGSILQRFGTPSQYTASSTSLHYFGVKPAGAMGYITGGVHNVFYHSESATFPGKESMSLFVNSASNTGKAYAVEFVLKLTHQDLAVTYNDTVFDTDYVAAQLSFAAQAQGGARAIGKGVLLAMSGADATGLEVADVAGNTHSYAYPTGASPSPAPAPGPGPGGMGVGPLYDPFIYVTKA